MARKKEPISEATFEESLANLEAIVKKLEAGEANLTDLMQSYAEGVELAKRCLTELEKAEKAMDIVVGEDSGKVTEKELIIEETI
ncbi:MAG: exodeoxyribonuclease VII small subunit [Selenomonadaceae bacterium]|nr:exodeoxyribonuclease VII small subunit [Selenomonadaceae bacterium]